MPVPVFEFHLGVDAFLDLLQEIQDILLVAQVTTPRLINSTHAFSWSAATIMFPMKIFVVELASALAHVGQDVVNFK